ncbi:MAG TPA: ATP-binding cassette domain-containing protein [Mycobacteriales bacterium]|nr:ATP-binding cassette domain-containing protein [Mycobacteriales bacterium]
MSDLVIESVVAGYGGTDVLRGVSLTVRQGECVGIIGPNGAGKSTLLKVISGQLRIRSGHRRLLGKDATSWPAYRMAAAGVRWVGEPRPIFPSLTVRENLEIGGMTRRGVWDEQFKRVCELLPVLGQRQQETAAQLSGGQQQMLAIGSALMSAPSFLCFDEPSIGLAPSVVNVIAELVSQLVSEGVGVVWAEQFLDVVLPRCSTVALLRSGEVVERGATSEFTRERLEDAYFG